MWWLIFGKWFTAPYNFGLFWWIFWRTENYGKLSKRKYLNEGTRCLFRWWKMSVSLLKIITEKLIDACICHFGVLMFNRMLYKAHKSVLSVWKALNKILRNFCFEFIFIIAFILQFSKNRLIYVIYLLHELLKTLALRAFCTKNLLEEFHPYRIAKYFSSIFTWIALYANQAQYQRKL